MPTTPAAKKTAAAKSAAAKPTPAHATGGAIAPAETFEGMPAPAPKPPKTERLFIAWTGGIVGTGHDAAEAKNDPNPVVRIDDLRVFGVKADCTEFAVDQEPAWKWVETTKGESVTAAILAKRANR